MRIVRWGSGAREVVRWSGLSTLAPYSFLNLVTIIKPIMRCEREDSEFILVLATCDRG